LIALNFIFNTMWQLFKTKKITILAILTGLTYAFLIFSSFVEGWDDFRRGWHEGEKIAEYNKWGDVVRYKPSETESYNFSVKPKRFLSYPDSLVNLNTNHTIQTTYVEMLVLGPKSDSTGTPFVYKILLFLLGSSILVALIRIPVHFYKLIGLIKNEIIFEMRSISLARWLGFELLFVYFAGMLGLYFEHKITSSFFSFSDYEIVMGKMDPIWLLLGIVSLLMAEVLSKAMAIKEEQELTI